MSDGAAELRILLVDDDGAVLAGLRNVLRSARRAWEVRTAGGGPAALEAMAAEPADVVVSDMRMPGMDGVTLLGRIREGWPGTVRILLSGWADAGSLTRAAAVAHRYLLKPCDPDTLRSELAEVERVRALLPDPGLRAALGALHSLPSSPATLRALGELPPDLERRNLALSAAVETDVALATRVLQFVSSPSFGSPRPVTGLRAAIGLVGPALLRELASHLEPLASAAELPGALDSLERLDRHAHSAARIARALSPDDADGDPGATAALLHDAGRLAILARLPRAYAEVMERSTRGASLLEAERQVLGADHARIGAYLLGLWGLPRALVDAVSRHHDEGVLDDPGLAGAVAAANLLAHQSVPRLPAGASHLPLRSTA
ncbi:MAG TPA: HDOD domain-containing protein [Anaeromyxobacteraceae bacterium]|nr:HDOD domain-containing protein [Anaeromyxobacteraceae bacterium]